MDLEDKLRNIRNDKGVTLYDHIVNILGKILLDKQDDPYNNFEKLSYNLKTEDVFLGYSDAIKNLMRENGSDLKEKIQEIRNFLKLDKVVVENEGDEDIPVKEEEEPPTNVLSNLLSQNKIMKKCGVSLGEDESYLILNALKQFSASKNAAKCLFWGKIMGHKADYYIVECTNPEKSENAEEAVPVEEPAGVGINAKTYFVTTNILSNNWTELPVISAKTMRQAKKIRFFFSGDLKRKIIMSPEFDGEERHYVR